MKAINIEGKKIGKLTVLKIVGSSPRRWKCRCDCGKEVIGKTWELKTGRKNSCGCNNPNIFDDLTGQKFGKLKVICFGEIRTTKSGYKKYFWKCSCDCGGETLACRGHLLNGKIKSCGCECYKIGKRFNHFKSYEEIPADFFRRLKHRATSKKRKIELNVSPKYLWKLFLSQNRKCKLSNMDLWFPKTRKDSCSASLDRIDSNKGYIEGNVQWVHKDINFMKQANKQDYFISLCKKVANHSLDKS